MRRSARSRFRAVLVLLAAIALFSTVLVPMVVAAGPSLTASPSNIALGGTATVSWSGILSPSKSDWIALYKVGSGDGNLLKRVYAGGLGYPTVARASGAANFNMPYISGNYEFRLFANGGWTRLAVSNPVTVGKPVTATPTPTRVPTTPTSTPTKVSSPATPTATPVASRTPTAVPPTSTPVASATATATPVAVSPDGAAEQAALQMINQSRQQYGLPPLTMYEPLRQVARNHAKDMAARNYFSHTTPEGLQPWDRISAAGISWYYVAENIGWGQGYPTPTDSVRANHTGMMAETPPNDGHRRNILSSQSHRIGIGVFTTATGKTYYVTDFID